MFLYEPMMPEDVYSMDLTNLDRKSENFTFDYYLSYLLYHPYDFFTVRNMNMINLPKNSDMIYTNPIIAYIFGKREAKEQLCFHLSAISVSPSYRAAKIGTNLISIFEKMGEFYGAYFVDLFVRESNYVAIRFYEKNGYAKYRKIIKYYEFPLEDAFDMRKSLPLDTGKELMGVAPDLHSEML